MPEKPDNRANLRMPARIGMLPDEAPARISAMRGERMSLVEAANKYSPPPRMNHTVGERAEVQELRAIRELLERVVYLLEADRGEVDHGDAS